MNERDYRELNVLGDIATDKKAFNQVKDELNPELFTGINKQIYQIIADLHMGGKCEYNTIVDKAIEMGIAKDDWGNPGLMRINAMINGAAECPFVEIQKDLAKLKDNPLNEFFGNDPSIPAPINHSCINNKANVGGLGGEPESRYALASKMAESVTKALQPRNEPSQSVTGLGSVSDRVKEYVENTTGWFSSADLDRECDIQPAEKTARRMAIKRLCDSGKLQSDSNRQGWYRYKNINTATMKFVPAAQRQDIPLEFPFDIQRYVKTLPKSIIVLAGVTGAGKTAFLIDFMRRNQDKFKIHYYCSELEDEGFSERWEALGIGAWKFEAKQISSNFQDYVALAPDDIHVIDYLEITDKFYLVNQILTDIHKALNKGVAIVALQKTDNKIYGRGGDHSAEKSTLYITLDNPELGTQGSHKLTLVKTRTFKNPAINPRGMTAEFKLVGGCQFIVTKPLGYGTQGLLATKQLSLV